jgi:Raf kinase inhibitor-like YbhB/YbcL family protein
MSFALLMDDPDAPGGTFNHWVLYDLPANTLALPARIPRLEVLPNGALQGTNENGEIGYLGPNPPRRQRHTYVFRVFALDTPQLTMGPGSQIPLGAGATALQLEIALEGHVLDQAPLQGTFRKRR